MVGLCLSVGMDVERHTLLPRLLIIVFHEVLLCSSRPFLNFWITYVLRLYPLRLLYTTNSSRACVRQNSLILMILTHSKARSGLMKNSSSCSITAIIRAFQRLLQQTISVSKVSMSESAHAYRMQVW